MDFKKVYLIPLTLFVLGISLLMSLPLWIALIPIVIVVLVVIYKFLKARAAQQVGAPTTTGWFGGKIKRPKISIIGIVAWTIVILLGFFMVYNGILEVPDRVLGATELKNLTVGNCKVQGESLVCTGPFTITIAGSSNLTTIGSVKVNPGSNPIRELDISAGLYLVEYSQGYIKDLGGECTYSEKDAIYHRAVIYYNGNPRYQDCYPVAVPTGMAPEQLWFGTNWLRLTQVFDVEDPYFYVGLEKISTSYIKDVPQQYMRYPIVLSSKQSLSNTTEISSVNIVHSRYKLI